LAAADDYEDDMEEGDDGDADDGKYSDDPLSSSSLAKGKRGRPRKHAPKIPLPPLYVFIREAPAAAILIFLLCGDYIHYTERPERGGPC